MTPASPWADRLVHLTRAFQHLKEQIRDAVALEMGKVVAEAVRDWITAALQTRRDPRFHGSDRAARDDDGWNDGGEVWNLPEHEFIPPSIEPQSPPPKARWAAALSVGAVTARWLIARRLPFVPSLGVGALAGAFALAGGPLVQTALSAAGAAADLARIARPPN